jgi:hypothetical protein
MKTNSVLILSIVILVGLVVYLVLNTTTQKTESRDYMPVVYRDRRPRDTVVVGGPGGWGWGFPTITWVHQPSAPHPPPPPSPPPSPPTPPPAPPSPPVEPPATPGEPPATFVDMSKNVEGFFSPASYPFA